MTKMITPLISNFLLYKTGFFHCIRKKSSGSSFSSDPASGGIPTLRPDGTLVYELTDLRQKRGDPKVLFFATDRLFHAEGLTEDQKIALDFFTQYLRRFQAYGYDSEGNLTELSSVFETPFQTIDLRDAALQAEIYEKLSHKKHIGPEETTEYISADEVLIIDDEFITRMIAMLLEADSHHPINHKIFRISMLSFMGDSDYLPPAFIQRLSEIRCASFEVVKGSRLEKVFGFLEHLPALEFLELKTDQACDADIFHHLPPKVLAQLIELRLTDTCPPSRPVKYSRISQFPSQAEAVSLSGFDVSDISLTTTRLREFRVGGPQSSELLKAMIPLSPFLTHIESTNREKVEMASSVRSSINVSGRAFSDLKFCRYAEEMPGTSSVDKFIRNPLDFNPQDDRPLQSQIVFVARAGREIPPHHYLKHFYQLENLENLETLGLKKIEFKASFPMVITNQNTRITRKNQYQGRLETFLNAGVIYNLPHLPHARMLAMKLPPHCALYQDERTGQYGIKSTIAQSALLEWLIQAEEPQQPKPLSAKSSRIFDDLSFIIREGKIQLNRPITWQRFSSEIQKIQSVAAWISGFSSKNAKTSASDFANPIDHLNAIIQGKKGRCSERAFLFEVMIRMLFPKIRSYYIENELHAFSLIQFDNRKALCFDLGGVEATLKIAPRVLVEPTAAPLPTPTRTPTPPLSTSVSPPKAALKKVSFESEGPAGAGGPGREPRVEMALAFSVAPPQQNSRTSLTHLTQRVRQTFLEKLHPTEKTYTLRTKDPSAPDAPLLKLAFIRRHKPQNACLRVQSPEALSVALGIFQAQAALQHPDQPHLFIAPSLESLRLKVFAKHPTDSKDPKFYLIDSPFKKFLESTATPKMLIIPEDLLLRATGVSAYYPLLDSIRSISPDLCLPPDIQLIVLIQEGNLKQFREDFRSRFQIHGPLDVHIPTPEPSMATAGSSTEPLTKVTPRYARFPHDSVLASAIRITPYNFHTLFPHPELTPDGLIEHPGFLAAEIRKDRPFLLSGGFSPEQLAKLSKAQAEAIEKSESFPVLFERPEFPTSPFLHIEPVMREEISMLIEQYRSGVRPTNFTVLGLPELGNPLLHYTQTGEAPAYETCGEYSELALKLMQENQTILLHGKLSETLRASLESIGTGVLFLAGQETPLGKGTRMIILAQERYAPHKATIRPDAVIRNPFCVVREGDIATPADLRPFEERLEAFEFGRERTLRISAFDLMNPDSRRLCRDLVNSAFAGQVMIHGKLKNLREIHSGEVLQTIEVSGNFIPSSIQKYAKAFHAYESAPSPASASQIIQPSTLHLSDERRATQDLAFAETDIVLTESRRKLIAAVSDWLSERELTANHPLFLVEGPSGIGKSAILRMYLKPLEESGDLIILAPSENLIREIAEANRNGKIIFIDELNTLRADQLEAIEALVRSRPNLRIIGTQNPISFSGRAKLSSSLLEHTVQFHLKEYDRSELFSVCQFKGVPTYIIQALIDDFLKDQKDQKATFRDFLGTLEALVTEFEEEFKTEAIAPVESSPETHSTHPSSMQPFFSSTLSAERSGTRRETPSPTEALLHELMKPFEGDKAKIHAALHPLLTGFSMRILPFSTLKNHLVERLEEIERSAARDGNRDTAQLLYQTLKTLDAPGASQREEEKSLLFRIAHQKTGPTPIPHTRRTLTTLIALLKKVEAALELSSGHRGYE